MLKTEEETMAHEQLRLRRVMPPRVGVVIPENGEEEQILSISFDQCFAARLQIEWRCESVARKSFAMGADPRHRRHQSCHRFS